MSYVGEVKYDIFLSYAHGNPTQREWSLEVEKMLGDALNTHLGDRAHELSIFTDKDRLKGNNVIDEQLKPAIQSSAALLVILTDHYVKSPSCLAELGWFQETARTFERIFVIRARNVPPANWPPSLTLNGKTIFGYPFCDDSADALPYGMFKQQEPEQGQGIVKLSAEIAQFLRDQRAAKERARATQKQVSDPAAPGLSVPSITKPGQRPQVLIGFVIEELEEERRQLAERLAASKELEVLSPPFPDAANEVHDLADQAAKGGAALVQLCGRASGRWRRNTDGYVADQIGLFESYRRPTWLVMMPGVELHGLQASRYADFLAAREKRLKPEPSAGEIVQALRPPAGDGRVPSCTIYIQSRKDYELAERSLREQITAIRCKRLIDALTLPLPPIYTIADAQQLSALVGQRSQRAADIQAGLLILGDRPDLLVADLLEYRREKEVGAARWPAAIVAAPNAPIVTQEDVGGYPVFRLGDPSFDTAISDWLRGCLASPAAAS
jgi:hypothetical protein